ncbi:MAG: hypothetical protein EXS14_05595 [Planctomycetes bacterium]|nr:hypothetical protein [Planctomycetota bacterium]
MRSLAVVSLLILAACSTGSDAVGGATLVSLETAKPEALRVQGWLEFPTLALHSVDEAAAPVAPFLRGEFAGGWFTPRGVIEGVLPEPPARRVLVRGVLELSTRAFIAAGSERPARGAFIVGVQDQETGGFHPLGQPQVGSAGQIP